MKHPLSNSPAPRVLSALILAAGLIFSNCPPAAAQGASNRVSTERQAMRRLAFLAGRWSGPVTVERRGGQPLRLTQSESVQYKLDGLVLLVEGTSTDAAGKAEFKALATISYDPAARAYHIRAYQGGHYVDAPLSVSSRGFSWSFPAGPVRIVNTMHLTGRGRWQETSKVSVGGAPPRPSVEMLLKRRS